MKNSQDTQIHLQPLINSLREFPFLDLLLILLASFIIGQILGFLLARFVHIREKLESFQITPKSARSLLSSAKTLVTTIVALYGVELILTHPLHPNAQSVLKVAIILSAVWFTIALWDVFMDLVIYRAHITSNVSRQTERIILPFIRKLVRFLAFVIGFILLLSTFKVNVASLIAALGIGGIALSFAAKDSVENIFGSLTIVLDMPFGVGDWVKIGNIEGQVEEINMRSTRIRTADDSIITLPNGNLVKAAVENFGLRRHRRIKIVLTFSKDTSHEQIDQYIQNMRHLLEEHKNTKKESTYVSLSNISATGLEIIIATYIEVDTYAEELKLKQEILLQALRLAQELHINLAGPP